MFEGGAKRAGRAAFLDGSAREAGSSMACAMGVSMMPGSTMATRTPKGFISWARDSLMASSANFEAA